MIRTPCAIALTFCLATIANAQQLGSFTSSYPGYDPTGATDSTPALQACLNAASAVRGTCFVDQGAKLNVKIVTIPANTTLKCGFGFMDDEVNPASFASMPVIIHDGDSALRAAGPGARVENCLIYRTGMTFPAADASQYAGYGLWDAGYADFQAIDDVILGFATDIWIQGGRFYLKHDHLDGSGVGPTAALEIDTGNTDSGNVEDVKIQSIATGYPSCAAVVRAGTGLRVAGSPQGAAGVWMDNVVVQNFRGAQYDFENSVIGGKIWADNIGNACGYGSTFGVFVASGVNYNFDQVYINQQHVALKTWSSNNRPRINLLSINYGSYGLLLGETPYPAALNVGTMLVANMQNWAIYVGNPVTDLFIDHLYLSNINGRNWPYVQNPYSIPLGNGANQIYVGSIFSDIGPNIFSAP